MAITRYAPGTIHLGGPRVDINDLAAASAITPGMLVERFASGSVNRLRASTRTGKASRLVAVEAGMLNHGINDVYNAGDQVEAIVAGCGAAEYGLLASNQNVAFGARLQDNGDGSLTPVTGSNIAVAEALEAINNTGNATMARIRVEFI
jgi:hypothetical protein